MELLVYDKQEVAPNILRGADQGEVLHTIHAQMRVFSLDDPFDKYRGGYIYREEVNRENFIVECWYEENGEDRYDYYCGDLQSLLTYLIQALGIHKNEEKLQKRLVRSVNNQFSIEG